MPTTAPESSAPPAARGCLGIATRAPSGLPRLLVVAAALVDLDGRVLLAQRPELGIDITESCLAPFTFASHAYATFHLLMPLYLCRVWKGTPTSLEGQALKWVRPLDMRHYPMPPADLPLVAMLRDWL